MYVDIYVDTSFIRIYTKDFSQLMPVHGCVHIHISMCIWLCVRMFCVRVFVHTHKKNTNT